MKHYGLDKPGMKLGVVGLGGLGHMVGSSVQVGFGVGPVRAMPRLDVRDGDRPYDFTRDLGCMAVL
jgi:hypothetical protein